MDPELSGKKRLLQLNELDEFQHDAYENAKIYKERTKAWHDKQIMRKEFHQGQNVLLYNSRLKFSPSKFKFRWSGPFVVSKVFPSRAIKIMEDEKKFMVNGQRLKPYWDGCDSSSQTIRFRLE